MEKIISDYEKIKKIREHYRDNGLLIVGLNDSQGVNITSHFLKKGVLECLADALTDEKLKPMVLDAFSLIMNKTEHIDYFLKNNLNLEEIKLSQIYGAVVALEKVMSDVGLPKFLGQVGNVYRLTYAPKKGDEKINISTSLKEAYEPIMIYSSGVNDLMREVGANPFGIKGDYKARYRRPNYYYTLDKVSDPETLRKVMDAMRRNYENILGINQDTDIYTLGAYIPKSLQSEEMNIFRDLVIAYNEKLKDLCKEYGITFVDTGEVGKKYNNSENNFHISAAGHNALANHILGHIYHNKFESNNSFVLQNIKPFEITDGGVQGVIEALSQDHEQSLETAKTLVGYAGERELQKADEPKREIGVFQKIKK